MKIRRLGGFSVKVPDLKVGAIKGIEQRAEGIEQRA
jgi:hypothetical protein